MSQAKVTLHKHLRKGVPVLGAAGLSLWLSGGAPAATGVATTDLPTCSVVVDQEQTLREEEITDITLATFHIFDREEPPRLHTRIAGGAGCGACGIRPLRTELARALVRRRLWWLWIRPSRNWRLCRRRLWWLWIRPSRAACEKPSCTQYVASRKKADGADGPNT